MVVLSSANTIAAADVGPGAGSSAGDSHPLDCVPAIGTNQIVVPLPGLLLPLPSIKGLSEFEDLPSAPSGIDLPSSVDLRDTTEGFNDYAEFALRDGSIYTRPRESGDHWGKCTPRVAWTVG